MEERKGELSEMEESDITAVTSEDEYVLLAGVFS